MSWLDTFLPKLRCPHSGEALRYATDEDKQRAALPADQTALASASGSHVYPIIAGIPHLLPDSAIVVKAKA
jgi:uncharacterized protein YbaR (Trm112 family)